MTMVRPNRVSQRAAFTLIELVVVLAIILLLIGLLTAGVFRALSFAQQTKNAHEISGNLSPALEAFKVQYGFYPPSRLRLYKKISSYTNNQLDIDSQNWIIRMFPKINVASSTAGENLYWTNNDINWTPDAPVTTPFQDGTVLEGDQCLVFFLGGIPTQQTPAGGSVVRGCAGFSTSAYNPIPTPTGSRVKFYDFPADRLVDLHKVDGTAFLPSDVTPPGPTGFWSFVDTYRRAPYAYFSSYKTENGYNRYYHPGYPVGLSTSECAALGALSAAGTAAPWPFAVAPSSSTTPTRYYEAARFQIISAGRDGRFGPGTDLSQPPASQFYWSPTNAGTYASTYRANGAPDDQSNFYDLLLGKQR